MGQAPALLAALAAALLFSTACERPVADCAVLSRELQAALDSARRDKGIPGMVGRARLGECVWEGASGVAELESGRPVTVDTPFRIGSLTKSFVAATVVALHLEGALSLDDTLEHHLPGTFTYGQTVTVRDVLRNTSGLPEYGDHPEFTAALVSAPGRRFTPEELLDFALDKPAGAPGSYAYSNTNYVVAGLIVEKVTGEPFQHTLARKLLEPLQLHHTYLGGTQPDVESLAHGYDDLGSGRVDVTERAHPSLAWTSGAMVSTAADLERFYRALFAGELFDGQARELMTGWSSSGEDTGYGLGLERLPNEMAGHSGGIFGYEAGAFFDRAGERGALVLGNEREAGAEEVWLALFRVLDKYR